MREWRQKKTHRHLWGIDQREYRMTKKGVISKELLEVLACPKCKSDIELIERDTDTYGLKCEACRLIYPIKDGIPVMLIDEAATLD